MEVGFVNLHTPPGKLLLPTCEQLGDLCRINLLLDPRFDQIQASTHTLVIAPAIRFLLRFGMFLSHR
jgi:hypothetical protein